MVRAFVVFIALSVGFSSAIAAESKSFGTCHDYSEEKSFTPTPFKITFKSSHSLPLNNAGNFSQRFQFENQFGCTLHSKVQNLSGSYFSAEGIYLVLKESEECAAKYDYALTQFIDANGEKIFRIECEYKAYEDEDPIVFIPTAKDIEKLLGEIIDVQRDF